MEAQTNDIAQELALLHILSGANFSRQVEKIACRAEFRAVEGEHDIFFHHHFLPSLLQIKRPHLTQSGLFKNGAVSVKSYSHAGFYPDSQT